jgi:two-component system, cell cycle sensor histidine kinase and response regulator CckA
VTEEIATSVSGTRGPRWQSLSVAVVAFLVVAQAWPSRVPAQWSSDIVQLILAVFAASACVRAARTGRAYARTFWSLLATGVWLWVGGQLLWMFNEQAFHLQVQPALSEFFFLFSALPVILGCGVRPDRAQPGGPRLALDLALITLVAGFLYGYFVLAPYMGGDQAGYHISFRHLSDFSALLVLVVVAWLSRSSEPPWRPVYDRLAVALVFWFVGGRVADHAVIAGVYTAGLFDLAWTLPLLWIGLTALDWTHSPLARAPGPEPAAPDWRGIRRGTILTAAAVVAIPTFHFLMGIVEEPDAALRRWRGLVTVVTLGASAAIFLVRQLHLLGGVEDAQSRRENEIRILFQENPRPMWVYDVETLRFVEVNGAAIERYGYSREEFLARRLVDIRSREDGDRLLEMLPSLRQQQEKYRFSGEWTHLGKSGERIEVELAARDLTFRGRPATLVAVTDITERTRFQKALLQSEERFEKAFQASPAAITISALADGRYLDVNARFEEITGRSRAEIVGKSALDLGFWADPAMRLQMVEAMAGAGHLRHWPFAFRHRSGELRQALGAFERIEVAGEACVLAITEDVTERRDLEERLRQAEKLEAIGRLAGGIAHDFNNLLGVVLGYSELLARRLVDDPHSQKQLEAIRRASERAADLTRQLLAYGRKQVLFPEVLALGSVVEEAHPMLDRLLGEEITLHTLVESGIGSVRADRGQIELVIVNLALNARDGMPKGGTIRIECRNEPDPAGTSLGYVALRVQDEGQGLDAVAREHVFEPFFSPKGGPGEVAGLGLASVYGIVKQSGGEILVESEPGRGSVFVVRLPRVPAVQPVPSLRAGLSPAGGTLGRTILLVDDQEMVREMTRSVLDEEGYQVLVAADGDEALRLSEAFSGAIDLVITDVVMPGLSGPETVDRVRAVRPDARVIFVSGYTADALGEKSNLGPGTRFLQKPFKPDELAATVRAVLDGD